MSTLRASLHFLSSVSKMCSNSAFYDSSPKGRRHEPEASKFQDSSVQRTKIRENYLRLFIYVWLFFPAFSFWSLDVGITSSTYAHMKVVVTFWVVNFSGFYVISEFFFGRGFCTPSFWGVEAGRLSPHFLWGCDSLKGPGHFHWFFQRASFPYRFS